MEDWICFAKGRGKIIQCGVDSKQILSNPIKSGKFPSNKKPALVWVMVSKKKNRSFLI